MLSAGTGWNTGPHSAGQEVGDVESHVARARECNESTNRAASKRPAISGSYRANGVEAPWLLSEPDGQERTTDRGPRGHPAGSPFAL